MSGLIRHKVFLRWCNFILMPKQTSANTPSLRNQSIDATKLATLFERISQKSIPDFDNKMCSIQQKQYNSKVCYMHVITVYVSDRAYSARSCVVRPNSFFVVTTWYFIAKQICIISFLHAYVTYILWFLLLELYRFGICDKGK